MVVRRRSTVVGPVTQDVPSPCQHDTNAFASRGLETFALMSEIEQIDFVTTNNELEAILLENNLIKQHQPRYNILLRDDKTYPYIKVTMSEPFPRVVFTRRVDRKKVEQYAVASATFAS